MEVLLYREMRQQEEASDLISEFPTFYQDSGNAKCLPWNDDKVINLRGMTKEMWPLSL